ncbi:MAG: hypothetical protein AAB393_01805, partial [Bacteroidota bacterium]
MKLLTNTMMLVVFMAAITSIGGYSVNAQTTRIDEKFDGVTPEALPSGWAADPAIICGRTTWTTNAGA